MNYDDIFSILKTALNAANDKSALNGKFGLKELFQYSSTSNPENNATNTIINVNENSNENIYENNNEVLDEVVNVIDNESYNKNDIAYYNERSIAPKAQKVITNPITDALTPIKLQQAVILSEVIGKPRSRTRRKRRF